MEYKSYQAGILINKEDAFSTFNRNSFKNFVQGKEENEFYKKSAKDVIEDSSHWHIFS